MFSSHPSLNTLTALLLAHGIDTCVCCPGSRNAAILHNLKTAGLRCIAQTDERSAGFYALGLSLGMDRKPVAICVTSGSALLNVLPAVAEAFYQRVPLVVIAADRPQQWIGQQDGQTLPQPDAYGHFVQKAVNLPEPHDAESQWHCNRLVNEALLASRQGPVLINVPISEPLFNFNVAELPAERKIDLLSEPSYEAEAKAVLKRLAESRHPLIVVGQLPLNQQLPDIPDLLLLHEALSKGPARMVFFDDVIDEVGDNPDFCPDFILSFGGTLVSKKLKQWLRRKPNVDCWRIDTQAEVIDTFMNLRRLVVAQPIYIIRYIADHYQANAEARAYAQRWNDKLLRAQTKAWNEAPDFIPRGIIKYFSDQLKGVDYDYRLCSANSSVLRHACRFLPQGLQCNRGVNGIEGSLSTAAGLSLTTQDIVFCLIGDLSFFYDQNALWNTELRGNLRILLLNDGGGSIFNKFTPLHQSPAMPRLIAGSHNASARGICEENSLHYLLACNEQELRLAMMQFMTQKFERPVVFEIKLNK